MCFTHIPKLVCLHQLSISGQLLLAEQEAVGWACSALRPTCSFVGRLSSFLEAQSGNFSWLSRKTVGGLAQRGVSNGTPVPHSGGDRVNDLVFGQQLPPQLPPPLVRVRCTPDRWLGASSTIQSGLNREINTREL